METCETKAGLMFNVHPSVSTSKSKSCCWIRASDIIGIESWASTDYDYSQYPTALQQHYSIRVAFPVCKGISGSDSTIEVTKDVFNDVAEYLGLPQLP